MRSRNVIGILGPTASGKTTLVCHLARYLPLEVVSCDSMQVYRDLPVLSQAPRTAETVLVKHHLVGFLKSNQTFDAASFVRRAKRLITGIQSRRKWACVAGGTGLYAQALLDGLFKGPGASSTLRKKLEARAERQGVEVLYEELKVKDPAAASRIHPKDLRRIIRALEVHTLTGKPISELRRRQTRGGLRDKAEVRLYGLAWERSALYERIHRRVEHMFAAGAVEEVRRVLARKKLSQTLRGCIGLKAIGEYLAGRLSLAEAKERIRIDTRHYAKRQLGWFRRDKRIQWIEVRGEEDLQKAAHRIAHDLEKTHV